MKFTSFIALVSLSASAFGENVDTLRADVETLVISATSCSNAVLAFPPTIRLGSVLAAQKILTAAGIAMSDLGVLVNDAALVTAPLAVADGLALVALFNPIAQVTISSLQALQDRKAAIAALPSLGPINALVTINRILALAMNTTLALKAAFAKSVFTADALHAWNPLVDSVIEVENATILLFNSA